MHPIYQGRLTVANPHPNFGPKGIKVSFHNGTAPVANGYILKQMGTNKFACTDGTTMIPGTSKLKPYMVSLAKTQTTAATLTAGFCTISFAAVASGATFTLNYCVATAVVTATAGSGYTVGSTMPLTGAGGAILTVATLGAGSAVGTVTISTPGSTTSVASVSGVGHGAGTGGGSGATFNLTYKLLSVTGSGGTKYVVNEVLTFTGGTATTLPTAHISSVDANGAVTGVVVDTPGVGITGAPTVGIPATEYVSRIWDNKLRTVQGEMYKWTVGASVRGSVGLTFFS